MNSTIWPKTSKIGQVLFLSSAVSLIGCERRSHDHDHPHGGTESEGTDVTPDGHGVATNLGSLTLGSREYRVTVFGHLIPGQEGALEVECVGASDADLAKLNLYVWVESEDGTQLSAPSKGSREGAGLHFHVTPREGKGEPHRVVLRVRADGIDERAGLPLSGHGHEHHDGPHHGVLAGLTGKTGTKGFLELKLHDDKGDLELWLARDEAISVPMDLPVDSEIEVEFVDVAGRKVTLRARNHVRNEDEGGQGNVRDGKTHYFIYPSQPGQDAVWLQGKEFSSIVVVRFSAGGEQFESEEFVLKPHVH